MRNRLTGIAVALAAFAPVTAACTSSTPPGYIAPTPQISLDPAAPCPHSLGAAQDVENRGSGFNHRLVPKDVPSGGLICVYRRGYTTQTAQDAPRLSRQVRLTATDAAAMTRDLPLVSLDPIRATFSCPGGPGRLDIISFAYTDRTAVSLWYDEAGCPRLDNGHIVANGMGNPSFYDHFAKRVQASPR
jgi:hypothetical protein